MKASCSVWDRLRSQVQFECEQLNRLVHQYRPLLAKGAETGVDDFETASIGAMLHAFYNGVESIFKRIALEIDGELPHGEFWHRELLERMAQPGAARPAVISADLCEGLKLYLHFRHVFRSAYVFLLRWDKMAPLAAELEATLQTLESELRKFADF